MTRATALGQELRSVHARLRRAVDLARAAIDSGEPVSLASTDLQIYCTGFCLALSEHHTSEDDHLFPAVVAAHPELADLVADLRRDHSMLSHLIRGFDDALAGGSDADGLTRHLDGIEAVMLTHFTYEEKRLVPLLDGAGWGADEGATAVGGDVGVGVGKNARMLGSLASD